MLGGKFIGQGQTKTLINSFIVICEAKLVQTYDTVKRQCVTITINDENYWFPVYKRLHSDGLKRQSYPKTTLSRVKNDIAWFLTYNFFENFTTF